jgi:hypothetical protein
MTEILRKQDRFIGSRAPAEEYALLSEPLQSDSFEQTRPETPSSRRIYLYAASKNLRNEASQLHPRAAAKARQILLARISPLRPDERHEVRAIRGF